MCSRRNRPTAVECILAMLALAGIVQLDDAYWGGERHGGSTGRGSPGKTTNGSPQGTPFVAAVQITTQGFSMAMRMDVVPSFRKTALAQWAQHHLAPGTAVVPWGLPLVVSDGLNCFPGVTAADCTHVPRAEAQMSATLSLRVLLRPTEAPKGPLQPALQAARPDPTPHRCCRPHPAAAVPADNSGWLSWWRIRRHFGSHLSKRAAGLSSAWPD